MNSRRLGLVGFNTPSGLGAANRQLCRYLRPSLWLIVPHKRFPTLPTPRGANIVHDEAEFLGQIDVLLFVENPLKINLAIQARQLGKRLVCVPMQEWMPEDLSSWPNLVDLFLCPTAHCYHELYELLPCAKLAFPVDTDSFPFRQRTVCKRFVYLHGHGGWHDRKGGDVVAKALALWPSMPLTVYSQRSADWPSAPGAVDNPQDLYAAGDVLIAPHRADGLGLEILEAASSGMPIVSTDGQPWNEYPQLAKIKSTQTRQRIKRMVDWYEPSAESLVEVCRGLLGADISDASDRARTWAEARSWDVQADDYLDLVVTEHWT